MPLNIKDSRGERKGQGWGRREGGKEEGSGVGRERKRRNDLVWAGGKGRWNRTLMFNLLYS